MPTGATLVFSHGQSRENNSWASDGAPAPNAGATRGERGNGERQTRREGFQRQNCTGHYMGCIVINLCWKWKNPEGEAPRPVYEPASLNKWDEKGKDSQWQLLFNSAVTLSLKELILRFLSPSFVCSSALHLEIGTLPLFREFLTRSILIIVVGFEENFRWVKKLS